ncbi:unnamed protein product [Withania somnifera]
MTRVSFLILITLLICCFWSTALGGALTFYDDDNPIRQVVSKNSILQVIGQTRHALSFLHFARRYGKRYESVEEMKQRFEIFLDNLKMIRSHNKKRLSYKLGVNEFTDLTWDEFRRERLGAPQNCSATTKSNLKLTNAILPETKDWREAGIISPVKKQGKCGSCWTFSTTGALEAAYAQAFGKKISLSEQQLLDCAGSFNNFGCNGGLPSQAFEYIKYTGGLDTEEEYPYIGKGGVCKFSSENVAVQVLDSVNITKGAEDELKYAVAFIRPVSLAYQVIKGFKQYESGIYSSSVCGNTPNLLGYTINHAIFDIVLFIERLYVYLFVSIKLYEIVCMNRLGHIKICADFFSIFILEFGLRKL